MARFDSAKVLDRAARVFWCQGYYATSIQYLEAATALGSGSLYNTFGGKAALFRAVLARYGETAGAAPLRLLGDRDVFAGLSRMLRAITTLINEPARAPGCLITNACTGDAATLDDIVAIALANWPRPNVSRGVGSVSV